MTTQRVDTGYGEEDFDVPVPDPGMKVVENSPLEALRGVLATVAENKPVVIRVPNREGISVRFATNVEEHELKHWTRAAQVKVGGRSDTNAVKFASLVIAARAEAILFNGEEVFMEGSLLNFRHQGIRGFLGLDKTASHVVLLQHFYGNDGHIITVANEVLAAAGWGDDGSAMVEDDPEANPT